MTGRLARKRHLSLERLEDRVTPTVYGQQWLNPQSLTLSFAPDGTRVGNTNSGLMSFLSHRPSLAMGEEEILRAFQTWAVNANINIGLVRARQHAIRRIRAARATRDLRYPHLPGAPADSGRRRHRSAVRLVA